jgi:hypothetical protein
MILERHYYKKSIAIKIDFFISKYKKDQYHFIKMAIVQRTQGGYFDNRPYTVNGSSFSTHTEASIYANYISWKPPTVVVPSSKLYDDDDVIARRREREYYDRQQEEIYKKMQEARLAALNRPFRADLISERTILRDHNIRVYGSIIGGFLNWIKDKAEEWARAIQNIKSEKERRIERYNLVFGLLNDKTEVKKPKLQRSIFGRFLDWLDEKIIA